MLLHACSLPCRGIGYSVKSAAKDVVHGAESLAHDGKCSFSLS